MKCVLNLGDGEPQLKTPPPFSPLCAPAPSPLSQGKTTSSSPIFTPAAHVASQKVLAMNVLGTVKWFNVKHRYSLITQNDNKDDVFVHQTVIKKNNPRKYLHSLGDGEIAEFNVIQGIKGPLPVQGSKHAPNCKPAKYYPCHRSPHTYQGNITQTQQLSILAETRCAHRPQWMGLAPPYFLPLLPRAQGRVPALPGTFSPCLSLAVRVPISAPVSWVGLGPALQSCSWGWSPQTWVVACYAKL
uniref:Uncharacterized protein n=1 Tax=Geospiza parvula TaxID=87175 RepID=A0A8C3M5G3_GEOPR